MFKTQSIQAIQQSRAQNRSSFARIGTIFLLPIALTLSACASLTGGGDAPAQKEPARLDLSIEAARDQNADIRGRGAPMLLRVYELKSEVAFQEADYFALQNTDKAVLGADLLAVDQFVIRPGETRQIKRKSNPQTTAIGIFAGYRDLPNATWRVIHKMPPAPEASWMRAVIPSYKAKLKIELQANAIVMTDEEAGTAPVQRSNESMKGLEQSQSATDDAAKAAKGFELPKLPSLEKSPLDEGLNSASEAAKKLLLPK